MKNHLVERRVKSDEGRREGVIKVTNAVLLRELDYLQRILPFYLQRRQQHEHELFFILCVVDKLINKMGATGSFVDFIIFHHSLV